MRVQGIVLKHHGDVSVFGRDFVNASPADPDFSAGNILQPGNHAQRRAFSAAARSDQHQKLFVDHLQVEMVNRHDATIKNPGDSLQVNSPMQDSFTVQNGTLQMAPLGSSKTVLQPPLR